MPEIEIQPRTDRLRDLWEPSLLEVLFSCPEGSSLMLETPNRRQGWQVIDRQWRCIGDVHKEVF